MCGGISSVNQGVQAPQSTGIQGEIQAQQTDIPAQVEETLGGQPTAPLAANVIAQQAIAAAPLALLGEAEQVGVATAPERLAVAQNLARAGLAEHIGITVPPGSNPAILDSRMMAGEIESLPKGQRSEAMANAGKTLQQRVNNGFKVFQSITIVPDPNEDKNKKLDPLRASEGNIRDLMTFLTAKASQKTASFSEGAFNLPDPGNKILNFLDSSTESYQRSSTHIEEFSDQLGCGHRGIDLKLPHGKGTLLYGAMKDGVMGTIGDRIFLKMEGHGCRFSSLSQTKVDPQGPASRPKRFMSDLLISIKHGWGGIKTLLGLQNTKETRNEGLDKGVEKGFKALVKTARATGGIKLLNMLNQNNPAGTKTGQGVRTMMANISRVLETEYTTHPETGMRVKSDSTLPPDLKAQLISFKNEIDARYDNVMYRIGNEVVFNKDELDGTGNAREQNRDGQARSLVSQLMGIKDPAGLTGDTLKDLLTTMYSLLSTVDGEGFNNRVSQKGVSLGRATTGLNPQQKAHLKEIMTSNKMQDLINELFDRTMGMRLDMPNLTSQQELNVRGLMSDAGESLMQITQETGAEPRLDGKYGKSQVTGLSDTIFELTEGLAEPMVKMRINNYISNTDRSEASAIGIQAMAGDGKMVAGSSALKCFSGRPPSFDQNGINALAKEEVKGILMKLLPVSTREIASKFGLPHQFIIDFDRNGVMVNGELYGRYKASPEERDEEVKKFVRAFGPEGMAKDSEEENMAIVKARNASLLLSQGLGSIPSFSYDATMGVVAKEDLIDAKNKTLMGPDGNGGSKADISQSINLNDDGSAVVNFKTIKGIHNYVMRLEETNLRLNSLTDDLYSLTEIEREQKIEEMDIQVQARMFFFSND